MTGRFFCIAITLWLSATAVAAQPGAQLSDHRALALTAPSARGETRLTIKAFGDRWRLVLRDNAALLADLGPRGRERIQAGGHRFMAGEVAGRPDSWVRLNWTQGRWWGGFHDGQALYLIDRAGDFNWADGEPPSAGQDIVFRLGDVQLSDIFSHEPLPALPASPAIEPPPSPSGEAGQALPVTIVADSAFQDEHGGNASAIATGRLNFVDGIYSDQLGTGITLEHIELLDDDGPLTPTDASELLNAFREFMAQGDGGDIPFAGLGHLFTSRPRDGGIAGIAYLSALCSSSFGYGVDWDASSETINSLVFAHELGHNFGAPHDGEDACEDETFDGIMAPSINGTEEFSQCSLTEMQARVDNASCLITNPDEGLIFGDAFEALLP